MIATADDRVFVGDQQGTIHVLPVDTEGRLGKPEDLAHPAVSGGIRAIGHGDDWLWSVSGRNEVCFVDPADPTRTQGPLTVPHAARRALATAAFDGRRLVLFHHGLTSRIDVDGTVAPGPALDETRWLEVGAAPGGVWALGWRFGGDNPMLARSVADGADGWRLQRAAPWPTGPYPDFPALATHADRLFLAARDEILEGRAEPDGRTVLHRRHPLEPRAWAWRTRVFDADAAHVLLGRCCDHTSSVWSTMALPRTAGAGTSGVTPQSPPRATEVAGGTLSRERAWILSFDFGRSSLLHSFALQGPEAGRVVTASLALQSGDTGPHDLRDDVLLMGIGTDTVLFDVRDPARPVPRNRIDLPGPVTHAVREDDHLWVLWTESPTAGFGSGLALFELQDDLWPAEIARIRLGAQATDLALSQGLAWVSAGALQAYAPEPPAPPGPTRTPLPAGWARIWLPYGIR